MRSPPAPFGARRLRIPVGRLDAVAGASPAAARLAELVLAVDPRYGETDGVSDA